MSTDQTTSNALSAPTDNISYIARIQEEGQKLAHAVDMWESALKEKQSAKFIKDLHDEIMMHKNIIDMLTLTMNTCDVIEASSSAAAVSPSFVSSETMKHKVPERLPKFAPRANKTRFFDLEEYFDELELCLTASQTPRHSWTYALLSAVDNDLELSKWILHEVVPLDWDSAKSSVIAKLSHPYAQEHLERNFKSIKLSPSDSIAKFTDKFINLAMRLGRKINEKLLIQHFLLSLPPRFIIIARNCGLDFDDVNCASLWAQKIESSVLFDSLERQNSRCSRCKSTGHVEEQCKRTLCTFCKALGHLEANCRKKAASVEKRVSNKSYSQGSSKSEITCFKCKSKGHLANVCRMNSSTVNSIEEFEDDSDDKQFIQSIKQDNSAYLVPIKVNNIKILATLDTGASTSILSADTANKLSLKISSSNPATFRLAKKNTISPCLGSASVDITCNGRTVTASLPIMDLNEDVSLLLGRDLFKQFNFMLGNIPVSFGDKENRTSSEYSEETSRITEDPLDEPTRQCLLTSIKSHIEDNLKTSALFCNLEESKVHLRTRDSSVSFVRQYPIPRKFQEPINEIIQGWIKTGVVIPSPQGCQWNSPLLAVEKKDANGNLTAVRVCLDPRKINEKLLDDNYPIPEIKSILNRLEGFSVFSTIDLASSYNQFPIVDQDREKTAFTWNNCQYMFAGAPFGLKTMTSIFQRVTSRLFSDLPYVCTYIDDILICSKTLSEHASNVKAVLERLTKANLTVNPGNLS